MTGTRSFVEDTGQGATTKDGGQIDHDDLVGSAWKALAGQHGFADSMLTQPTPCAAIA